jgi:hypothetical protein
MPVARNAPASLLPDRLAVSDDSAALWGFVVRQSQRQRGVLTGTSAAAPQVARELLNRI